LKPSFDADLLDQYYEDIKNEWWQNVFCNDIYFPSSDGIVYKNKLSTLPNDQRYTMFFTKSLRLCRLMSVIDAKGIEHLTLNYYNVS
jgi:hypothetical protein